MSAREFGLGVYIVVDAASTAGRPLADVVAGAVAGGADVIQLRCKDLPPRTFLAEVMAAAAHTAGRSRLVVNDRVDVFLAARAAGAAVDGMHIGQSDLPPEVVRSLIGDAAILGLSASTPAHFAAVAALPAGTVDYLGTGAVRPTPTKKDHPEPLGFAGLARLLSLAPLPCVAIGGLGHGDATAVHDAGARGMAVVRAVCAAADPRAATASLRSEWNAVAAAGVPS